MELTWQDYAIRALVLACGAVAAGIFILKGEGQTLIALAIGGSFGAGLLARFGHQG
ncbi:MAG: hypothetical protein WBX15_00610 [Thermoanaerobaculia bacterium]